MIEEPKQEKKRGPKWLLIWGCLGMIVCLGAFFYLYKYMQTFASTDDAFIDGFRIDLSSDMIGRIIELKVDEGDFVKKGDVVAILQQDILLSQKNEAQAALLSAEQNTQIEKALYEKLLDDYERGLKGIEDKIISNQDFDHIQKDFEQALFSYKKALADQDLAKTKIEVIDAHLFHTYIIAPMDGMISKRWIFIGDVVRPSQAIFSLYDLENVWIQANLSEKEIEYVKLKDRVKIKVDAYPDINFEGEIFTIKGAAASQFSVIPQNNATGNYTKVAQRIPIKITLEPPPSHRKQKLYLFPGMNAKVKIKLGQS